MVLMMREYLLAHYSTLLFTPIEFMSNVGFYLLFGSCKHNFFFFISLAVLCVLWCTLTIFELYYSAMLRIHRKCFPISIKYIFICAKDNSK